ncbi:MAG: hypothetical protein H7X77_09495, partial [Anaerolineae bacterium]|nr:hypothetical protein [Anaerolineae bacterium]
RRASPPADAKPKPKAPRSPNSPLSEAQRKLDAMDDFKDRATDKTRNKLDEQNSRNDFE